MLSKQLQDQIEQEAKAYANQFKYGAEYREPAFADGANAYAALYETALARAERAEKALNVFSERLNGHCGRQGIYSIGIHSIIDEMKMFALTPKTGEDDK